MHSRADIVLAAINARYSHPAYGLRSLQANLGALRERSRIIEADLEVMPFQLAESVCALEPRIAAFSVYIWNADTVRRTVAILRRIRPGLKIEVGGPEITDETAPLFAGLADAVVIGEGETVFRRWCAGELPGGIIHAEPEDLSLLAVPEYVGEDFLHRRTVYVESTRGCPYGCSYCTSGGTKLRRFPLPTLFAAWEKLLARGARDFKFLDRSFNADVEQACAVIDFFRRQPQVRLHFEIHPGFLHPDLRTRLEEAPKGMFHLEVGVQTLDPVTAARIGRTADCETVLANTAYLCRLPSCEVHADLIFGLPGETDAGFAAGFDRLVKTCRPPELQVNLLKRLPGTKLASEPGLVFNPAVPYEVLASDAIDFDGICRLQRFARCWELVHNRGRFPRASRRLIESAESPFAAFAKLADRIYREHGKLYAVGNAKLAAFLAAELVESAGLAQPEVDELIRRDREDRDA